MLVHWTDRRSPFGDCGPINAPSGAFIGGLLLQRGRPVSKAVAWPVRGGVFSPLIDRPPEGRRVRPLGGTTRPEGLVLRHRCCLAQYHGKGLSRKRGTEFRALGLRAQAQSLRANWPQGLLALGQRALSHCLAKHGAEGVPEAAGRGLWAGWVPLSVQGSRGSIFACGSRLTADGSERRKPITPSEPITLGNGAVHSCANLEPTERKL